LGVTRNRVEQLIIVYTIIAARDDVRSTIAERDGNVPPAKPIEHWPCARALARRARRVSLVKSSFAKRRHRLIHSRAAARDPCSENARAYSGRQYYNDNILCVIYMYLLKWCDVCLVLQVPVCCYSYPPHTSFWVFSLTSWYDMCRPPPHHIFWPWYATKSGPRTFF